jgi:glycosyltransferase involved in cell wall biosynthesis
MLSILMPAYNEATSIADNVRETAETMRKLSIDFEIIVIDDGSMDGTDAAAIGASRAWPGRVRVVRCWRNEGKGNALLCGASYARGEYVAFLDADMDLHPEQLASFLAIMKERRADVVIGSKFHPDSKIDYPFKRRIYSLVYFMLIRSMFGLPVRDTQTGIKLFKREVLTRVLPRLLVKRFAFDIELLANAHRLGFRIVDAPVTLNFQRVAGRLQLQAILKMLRDTFAIFYRMEIIRYYDRIDCAPVTSDRAAGSQEVAAFP